jgi:hypothetical protein
MRGQLRADGALGEFPLQNVLIPLFRQAIAFLLFTFPGDKPVHNVAVKR